MKSKVMQSVFEQAVKGRAFQYGIMLTGAIDFSPALLKACEKNVCGKYDKCWTCPPASGSVETQKEKIMAFSYAFVFTTKSILEDSFDYEGMMRAKDCHNRLTDEMHEKFGKTNLVFGAGGCTICEACNYPAPCRFPDKIYSSIEAAGINVTELSRTAGLKYNNGENTVTYFSMVLFND